MSAGSFGEIAREVVRAEGGGRYVFGGLSLASHFQPVFSVRTGSAQGFEALLRAESAERRPLRARALFQSLDRTARTRLDWVCRALHLRNFAVVDPGDRQLSLNVHPLALVDDVDDGRGFVELVRFYGLTPERVVLEVLETDSGNEPRLGESVAAHRALGFTVAMDHFGQGQSNFDRIAMLRPKIVKADRATLRGALGETQGRRMLPSLVDMLKDTGAEVAIKGIDSPADAIVAIESGAAYLQGFHLGPPSRQPREETLSRELIESARHLIAA
jgi:EAL domain-containing protein (putative c-di-GMP-specific phosphodiesterase class I)